LFIFYKYYVFRGLFYKFFYCWGLSFNLGFAFLFVLIHICTFRFRVSIIMSFFKLCSYYMNIIMYLVVYFKTFYLFCYLYMKFTYCWGFCFNLGFVFVFRLVHISTFRFRVSINMSFLNIVYILCILFSL
jgi:hypothetical protein